MTPKPKTGSVEYVKNWADKNPGWAAVVVIAGFAFGVPGGMTVYDITHPGEAIRKAQVLKNTDTTVVMLTDLKREIAKVKEDAENTAGELHQHEISDNEIRADRAKHQNRKSDGHLSQR